MTEQEYLNSKALYHPAGGYKTGKIYDIRDTDNTSPYDLEVTGGGGTRTLADGTVEDIGYYNELYESEKPDRWSEGVGASMTQEAGHLRITEDTANSQHYVGWKRPATSSLNYDSKRWYYLEVKKVDARYIIAGTRSADAPNSLTVDLDTNTIVRDDIGSADPTQSSIEILSDGWIRITWYVFGYSNDTKDFTVGFANGETASDISYTGTGKSILMRPPMVIGGTTKVDKPLQIRPNESIGAQIVKIDHSNGIAEFLLDAQRTNFEPYSYDLTTSGSWTATNELIKSLNQVGITGVANTGMLLDDSSINNYGQFYRSAISLTAGIYKTSTWILKDNDETRFPEVFVVFVRDSDGTNMNRIVQLNTKTGAISSRSSGYEQGIASVLDRGLWWEVVIMADEPVKSISTYIIRPAMTDTMGTYTGTARGTIVLGHVGIYNTSVIDQAPIITTGAATTITENRYDQKNTVDQYSSKWIYSELELIDSSMVDVAVCGVHATDDANPTPRTKFFLKWTGTEWQFHCRPSNTGIEDINTGITTTSIKVAINPDGDTRVHTCVINGTSFQNVGSDPSFGIDNLLDRLTVWGNVRLKDLRVYDQATYTVADMEAKTAL